ncbi:MAG: tyrosine-protein phosphatase [Solirubrobacteraceae bacterium]
MASISTDVSWIELDGAVNARVVVPGVLLRSDNLQALTPTDISHLVDAHGLQVVIDLRTDAELVLEGPGPLHGEQKVRIVHHSLYPSRPAGRPESGTVVSTADIWESSKDDEFIGEPRLARTYLAYLTSRPDSVVAAVREIAVADGAVLVHCAAGKDRTGTVVALALDAAGVPRDQIVRDYMASADRIEEIFVRLLGSPTYRAELEGENPQDHSPQAGTIERVLQVVDARYGGSAAYLRQHGLGEPELQKLRRRIGRS